MRVVTSPNFCRPCIEGLWHALLKRVDLIDKLYVGCALDPLSGSVRRFVSVDLLSLGQFRKESVPNNETYSITWRKDGREIPEYANKSTIFSDRDTGNYSIEVRFATDEVRKDPLGYLTSSAELKVTERCISGTYGV